MEVEEQSNCIEKNYNFSNVNRVEAKEYNCTIRFQKLHTWKFAILSMFQW